MTAPCADPDISRLAAGMIEFLQTGVAPVGLFRDNVFCDFTPPLWRVQAQGIDAVVALRHNGHPATGSVTWHRIDPIPTGFVMELQEAWSDDAEQWTCREMLRADVVAGAIAELSVYCTGDWDTARRTEHAAEVRLLRD